MKRHITAGIFVFSTSVMAADIQSEQSLSKDCYQEWQSRGWTLGEDRRPADEIQGFREGIMRICEVRTELFLQGADVSLIYRAGYVIWHRISSLQTKMTSKNVSWR